MAREYVYVVRAFDTDYGYDTKWICNSEDIAKNLIRELVGDFGPECEAYYYKAESEKSLKRNYNRGIITLDEFNNGLEVLGISA